MSFGKNVRVHNEQPDGLTRIDAMGDRPMLALNSAITTPPQSDPLVAESECVSCGGTGWVKEAVPFGLPNFGVLFPCHCKQAEWARREAKDLARLSNLDAVRDKTFATLNPF